MTGFLSDFRVKGGYYLLGNNKGAENGAQSLTGAERRSNKMDFGNKVIICIIGFCLVIVAFAIPKAVANNIAVNVLVGHQVYSNGKCVENSYKVSNRDIERYGDMETAIKAKNIKPSSTGFCKTGIAR